MIVLLGEAPPRGLGDHTPAFPPGSLADGWLRKMYGDAFVDRVDARLNVLQRSQPQSGKGSAFDRGCVQLAVESTVANLLATASSQGHDLVLLLAGKRLAREVGTYVMDGRAPRYHEEVELSTKYRLYAPPSPHFALRAFIVPHPSGVNRWWNELANRAEARRFARRMAR